MATSKPKAVRPTNAADKTPTRSIRLSNETWETLREQAEEHDRSISYMIAWAVEEWIEKNVKSAKKAG